MAEVHFRQRGTAQIEIAYNGKDALTAVELHRDPFDFILLELEIPVLGGIQFLRHMHGSGYKGAIGIVSGAGPAIMSLALDLYEIIARYQLQVDAITSEVAGVETDKDWDFVARLGVEVIQGYKIAKPMPIDKLVSWAADYRSAEDKERCPVQ